MAEAFKTFSYTAQDSQETMLTGEYSAVDQNGVASYLAGMGLTPIFVANSRLLS